MILQWFSTVLNPEAQGKPKDAPTDRPMDQSGSQKHQKSWWERFTPQKWR